ncbi:hypothetical protein LXA43DRAFT_135003 [Ganoderma leucocontextum]|nr:hypothetical protein LXA43DRAFT_135003 [Ganoderma leucocontextum]
MLHVSHYVSHCVSRAAAAGLGKWIFVLLECNTYKNVLSKSLVGIDAEPSSSLSLPRLSCSPSNMQSLPVWRLSRYGNSRSRVQIFVPTRGVAFRSTLILRDGTLYFLVVCVLDGVATPRSLYSMSRFLLNLRRHRTRTERQSITRTPSMGMLPRSFSTLTFSSNGSHSMGWSVIGDNSDDSRATGSPGCGTEVAGAGKVSDLRPFSDTRLRR